MGFLSSSHHGWVVTDLGGGSNDIFRYTKNWIHALDTKNLGNVPGSLYWVSMIISIMILHLKSPPEPPTNQYIRNQPVSLKQSEGIMRASTGLSLLFFAAEAAHAFVGHVPLHASSSTWQSASSFTSSPSSSLEARSRLRSTAKAGWAPGARTARIVVTRMGDVVWSKVRF